MSQDESEFQGEAIVGRGLAMTDRAWLFELAKTLDEAERYGAASDDPGGIRWIQISDEMASQLADNLRTLATRR